MGPRRQRYLDRGDIGIAETEVETLVIGARVAARRSRKTSLAVDAHARAVAIAIAAGASKSNGEPVVTIGSAVEKQHWRTTQSRNESVHPAVVVDVAKGRTARSQRRGDAGLGSFEASVMIEGEQWNFLVTQGSVDLLDIVEDVALGAEKIFPAIVVEIFQADAPSGAAGSKRAQARFEALVAEGAIAVIMVKAVKLARQHGDEDIGAAVVVVVLKNGAHAGKPLAIGGFGRPYQYRTLSYKTLSLCFGVQCVALIV